MRSSPVLTLLCGIHLVNDGALLAVAALIPLIRDEFGLSYGQVGILTGVGLAMTIGGQLLLGRMADRGDARPLLGLSYLFFAGAIYGLTRSWSYPTLVLGVGLLRLASSAYHPVGIAWISRRFGGQDREVAMGYQSAGGDAGVLAAFATSGFLGFLIGWRNVLLAWAVLSIGLSVLTLAFRRGFLDAPPAPRRPLELAELARQSKPALPYFFVGGAAFNLVVTFGPLYLADRMGLRDGQAWLAGLILSVWLAAGVVSALSYGALRLRFGRIGMLRAVYVAVAASAVGIILVPWVPAQIVFFGLMGGALFLTWPALFSAMSEMGTSGQHGTMLAVVLGVQLVGGLVLSVLAGELADRSSIAAPFALLAIVTIGAAILLAVQPSALGDSTAAGAAKKAGEVGA